MTPKPATRNSTHSAFGIRHVGWAYSPTIPDEQQTKRWANTPTLRLRPRNSQRGLRPKFRGVPPAAVRAASAFTLTELLVVIGIIAILVGLLFPIIGRVRRAAYVADTQNEISQLANACNQYYSTFNAYPGPLSNDQIESSCVNTGGTPTPYLRFWYNTTTNPPTFSNLPSKYYITGSENLVLGLMGGLRLEAGTPSTINGQALTYTAAFAPTEVGLGPLSLNPLSPARTPSFFPSGSNYLMWTETNANGAVGQTTQYNPAGTLSQFADQAGTMAGDSPIPEFVDRFPTPGPMPILYLRARTGAQGTLSFVNGSTYGQTAPSDPTTNLPYAEFQYDLGDIYAYTGTSIGLPTGNSHNLNAVGTAQNYPPTSWPPPAVAKAGVTNASDGYDFFVNSSITPTNTSAKYINYSSRPRAVDQFILISAGPDGIYGTADNITSFGNVSQ